MLKVTSDSWRQHRHLLMLAMPMILANITTPLLGLVDTAVLGHLPSVHALAGASIATLIITQLYWVCGFLRMTVTGLSAQQRGLLSRQADTAYGYYKPLVQGLGLALLLALGFLAMQQPILQLGYYFSGAEELTRTSMDAYFSVRIFGAPAALMNLVLIGWLIGQQQTKTVMLLQIVGNLLNVILNFVFVLALDWGVSGVAGATVVAEFVMLAGGITLALWRQQPFRVLAEWFKIREIQALFSLNTAMFLRNLLLQACLAFITFKGAQYGAQTAAANAILMQFFVLIALGLDGIAYAVEALIGEAKGRGDSNLLAEHTRRGLVWSSLFACVYSVVFVFAGESIIALLTDKQELINYTITFLPLMIVLPLVAHWCFLFDGVFVGLSRAKAMRDSMFISTVVVFFPLWWWLDAWQNWALWIAFLGFLAARGFSLGWRFYRDAQRGRLLR